MMRTDSSQSSVAKEKWQKMRVSDAKAKTKADISGHKNKRQILCARIYVSPPVQTIKEPKQSHTVALYLLIGGEEQEDKVNICDHNLPAGCGNGQQKLHSSNYPAQPEHNHYGSELPTGVENAMLVVALSHSATSLNGFPFLPMTTLLGHFWGWHFGDCSRHWKIEMATAIGRKSERATSAEINPRIIRRRRGDANYSSQQKYRTKMIKLFTLKQQKKDGDQKGSGGQQKKASAAQLRIQKDISELNLPKTCVTEFPDADDLLNFKLIMSPDEGFYRDGRFVFNFRVGSNYPHEPPKVKCATQVYHPNIDLEGNVCLNILREDWNPVLTINSIVYGLQFLFLEPNPEDPLNKEAADVLQSNRRQFEYNVKKAMRGGCVGETYFECCLLK